MDTLLIPILLGLTILTMVLGIAILSVIGFILLERTKDLNRLTSELNEYIDPPVTTQNTFMNGGLYRSMDGKYTANSLDDLVQQMVDDGEIDPNSSEPDELRNFFENLSQDEDEDDDENEPWRP